MAIIEEKQGYKQKSLTQALSDFYTLDSSPVQDHQNILVPVEGPRALIFDFWEPKLSISPFGFNLFFAKQSQFL